jgi:hypothetical protein
MWVLVTLYLLAVVGISFSAGLFLQYLADQGISRRGIDPTIFPIYDFEDIWQNLAYLGYFFKIFPAFLIIISICNEFSYKTHRQNIIDGLSRTEFFLSKLSFAAFLAILSALLILVLGLIIGFAQSDTTAANSIFRHIGFVPMHALQLFFYFLFAMFVAIVIRKTGYTIVFVLMYTIMIEPVAWAFLTYKEVTFADYLPLESISSMVPFPFARYILLETQNYLSFKSLAIGATWGLVFSGFIFYRLRTKDF